MSIGSRRRTRSLAEKQSASSRTADRLADFCLKIIRKFARMNARARWVCIFLSVFYPHWRNDALQYFFLPCQRLSLTLRDIHVTSYGMLWVHHSLCNRTMTIREKPPILISIIKTQIAKPIISCLFLTLLFFVFVAEFGYPAPQCGSSSLPSSFDQQRSFRQDLQRPSSNCASLTGVMRLIIVSVWKTTVPNGFLRFCVCVSSCVKPSCVAN